MKRILLVSCVSVIFGAALHGGITPGSKDIGAVWFIGDSIIQSNADGDANGSPRKSLYDLLTANGYTFTYTGHHTANVDGLPASGGTAGTNLYQYHSGISGSVIGADVGGRTGMTAGLPGFWTSGRLATVKPDVILIMLGTNDVDQAIDLPSAPGRLSVLLDTIYAQPGVGDPTILVANIPPNRTNLPGDPVNVAAFNAEVPGVVDAHVLMGNDVHFVDQFTPIENDYAVNMMGDNLHPNATGNNSMAQQWIAKIQEIVGGSQTLTVTGSQVAQETDNSAAAGMATAASYSAEILAADLIDASQPSVVSAVLDKVPFTGIGPGAAALNDGLGHPTSGTATGAYLPAVFGGNGHLPFTYTVTLETSSNYLGYEITEIRSFAGWNQNGSALANQNYEVLVSVVGDPGFTSLGVVTYAPFDDADTREAAASKVVLTSPGGVIATGVDAVRFVIMDHGFANINTSVDGSVFHEIDVIGSAVPVISVAGFEAALETNNSAAAGYATAATFSADMSSSDLINAGQPTLVSAGWDKTPFFQTDPVNDGDGHPADSSEGTYLPDAFGGAGHLPFTYTATLDTSAASLGYKITEIRSFAGWNQNGSALANQKYELLVSVVDDPEFSSLGTFAYAPFGSADTREAAATKMVLTGGDAFIATGVDAVRFIVLDHGYVNGNTGIDGSVFFEFDVIGSAVSVPTGAGISVAGSQVALETDNAAAAGYATAATYSGDISSSDLINAGEPTLVSAGWDKTPFFESDPVNDGDGHPTGSSQGTYLPATFGGVHLPFTYTAILDAGAYSLGYEITEIRSFAGWNQNGASLANQKYELQVSTVESPGFASLGVFEFSPFTDTATEEAAATKLILTGPGGTIATGVDAVRFIVLDHGYQSDDIAGSGIDGSVFFEFDVIGTAVTAGFDSWAKSHGIPEDEVDDSDHDSLAALLEYGLGFDPTMADTMPPLVAVGSSFEVTWPKGAEAAADPEITYAVRISGDLIGWGPPAPGDLVETASSITLSLDPAAGRRFARLEVSRSP